MGALALPTSTINVVPAAAARKVRKGSKEVKTGEEIIRTRKKVINKTMVALCLALKAKSVAGDWPGTVFFPNAANE